MDNLDNTIVYEGTCSTVTILLCKKTLLDNNQLKWCEKNDEGYCERYITLKEIYQQLKEKGYEGVIYVWEETPLSGTIYMCGNYQEGQWVKHGITRGYA